MTKFKWEKPTLRGLCIRLAVQASIWAAVFTFNQEGVVGNIATFWLYVASTLFVLAAIFGLFTTTYSGHWVISASAILISLALAGFGAFGWATCALAAGLVGLTKFIACVSENA